MGRAVPGGDAHEEAGAVRVDGSGGDSELLRLQGVRVLAVRDDAGAVRGGGGGLVLPPSGPAVGELPVPGSRPGDLGTR